MVGLSFLRYGTRLLTATLIIELQNANVNRAVRC